MTQLNETINQVPPASVVGAGSPAPTTAAQPAAAVSGTSIEELKKTMTLQDQVIDAYKMKTETLEKRINELEKLIAAQPAPAAQVQTQAQPPAEAARDIAYKAMLKELGIEVKE